MKKIFTFFMMTVVAITICATPQTKLPQLKRVNTTEQVTSPAQEQVLKCAMQDLSKRARVVTTEPAGPSYAAKALPINKAQKAPAETITLDGGVFLVTPEYEAASREWYIVVESNGYVFRLCWYGSADNYSGTYTFEDISWDYTWGWFQSSELFYEIQYSDVNMTISEQQKGEYLKQITLDATITDVNDKVYVLHIVHEMLTPKNTIETVLDNSQITLGWGQFVLNGKNDNLDVKLTVNATSVDGEYTQANFDANGTKIVYNGVEQEVLQAKMLVQGGTLDNGSLGYHVNLSFYNQDTVQHIVYMPAALPPAKDTIMVSCTNLEIDDQTLSAYGFITVSGSTDLYDVFAMYEGTIAEAGVYQNVAVSITDKITWLEPTESISATLTLAEENDGWHANLEVYGNDYNWYSIDMKYVVPEPTETISVSFDEPAIATYIPDQYNMFQMLNYGEEFEASMTIYGIGVGESFGMEDVLFDYAGIYDHVRSSSVKIADVKGKLDQKGDTTIITASVIGFNAIQYDIKWWYTVPTPVDTVEIEMPVKFSNFMDYGYYTLTAYSPDSSVFVSLAPMASRVAGTFVNDGMFGKFGAEDGRYDFYSGDTFIFSSEDWQNYTMAEGTLVVTMSMDGTVNAEAKMICSNAVYYHIKMTTEYNTHLDFDEPELAVDRTYTTEDIVFIEDQTVDNGYIYLSLTAADASDMAAFFFFVNEIDYDIYIPEGIYPINSSEEVGTVYANPGIQGNGVWPSYYAELLEDGSLVAPLWLLVGGTVEMKKDDKGNPHMEVNAVNSYGVPVHIVYDGTPTAVENVVVGDVKTEKLLKGGQLFIIRNGETYNIIGSRVR